MRPALDRETSLLSTQLTLAALPAAVPCARLHAKQIAREWGFSALAEAVELLVSELITNAIKAAQALGPGNAHSEYPAELPCVGLRLSSDGRCLLMEVQDDNPQLPIPAQPHRDDTSGRGLLLVEVLSDRWSYYHLDHYPEPVMAGLHAQRQPLAAPVHSAAPPSTGKVVWCELSLDAPRAC
jgi:anti-sigma regulatory factor (Ser/Thr protein kinase)